MIAKVEPLTTARALRGPFDYRLPPTMVGVDVGSVLLVPFGPRRMIGVVVDLAERSLLPAERLSEPLEALEQGVPAELVRLGLWVAEEYCSTPARGLGLVLPPGTGTGARPRVRSRRTLEATLTQAGANAVAQGTRLGVRQRAVLERLAAGPLSVGALSDAAPRHAHAAVRSLEARGLVSISSAERVRRPRAVPSVGAAHPSGRALTADQERVLAAILARMDGPPGADRRILLHGVTGSGKTEVYLRAVAAALERGRSAIVLVPEIALTPQTVSRFEARFGDLVAVLHSGLGAGERYDEWVRLRRGEARVCVGPRSAVFAPLPDLGLIVVDEEHEASYKQEGDPRYDARRVAERRAREAEAVLVAGTATPRPESRHRLTRAVLAHRVEGGAPPPVELVSSLESEGALHPRTSAALEEVRRRGEKAIVLVNRRGWSNFLSCRGCGHVWECPECDVTLVFHRGQGRLACHHCGHGRPAPTACETCGSISVARHGLGTERLESELASLVDPLPVMRLDADVAAARGGPGEVLARFDAAPAGILVGTQMVAKGHDFPDVTLGVVLDADATLRFPDFRAEERTFSLVAQLAGRSGRGPRGGRVVVQALEPEARALRFAARHDAEGFLAEELERRRVLCYPPFSSLIRVVCGAPEAGPETAAAAAIAAGVRSEVALDASVLGPAPLFRLKGRERAQVVVKAAERSTAVRAVRRAVEEAASAREHRHVTLSVDVDPV